MYKRTKRDTTQPSPNNTMSFPAILRSCGIAAALVSCVISGRVAAQQASSTPAGPAPLDFSGVVFGAYSYHTDSAAKASLGGENPNQFTVDRAYLTFRMPAGDNGQIRITTDIFQNTNSATSAYYQGWVVRLKYAYLQYTGLQDRLGRGSSLLGRIGVLHTVAIDHEESFWPRYLQQVALEKNGFFSSADAGVAGLFTLGDKWGEAYGTITNGPGYTAAERDRFKDVALRVSLTPFAGRAGMNGIVRSVTLSPWVYRGLVGSSFAAGGAGQTGPGTSGAITEGLERDRWGIFAGVKDRRLTAGIELAQRSDASETGGNTVANPRIEHDSTGRVVDGFVIARPAEWFSAATKSGWSVIARFDRFTPNVDPTLPAYAGTTPAFDFWILGLSYDLTQRMTFALDWQAQSPTGFPPVTGTNVRPSTPHQSTLAVHWQATF
jgi:hypothetical protein